MVIKNACVPWTMVIRSVLSVLLVAALSCPCAAQLNRIKPPCRSAPIKGTPLDPRTLIPCSEETHSDLQVVNSIESTF